MGRDALWFLGIAALCLIMGWWGLAIGATAYCLIEAGVR